MLNTGVEDLKSIINRYSDAVSQKFNLPRLTTLRVEYLSTLAKYEKKC